MNTLDTYLDSGLIEAYCLGTLSDIESAEVSAMAAQHPAVKAAIEETLNILEQIPPLAEPNPALKAKVLDFLELHLSQEQIDLKNPPLIHFYSDPQAWNLVLQNVTPDLQEPGMAARVLKESKEVLLSVVWLSDKLVEEKHSSSEFQESFFILEGECECDFEGKIVRFKAGDYFDIPPNTAHSIKNVSVDLPYVKGLVQRRLAA